MIITKTALKELIREEIVRENKKDADLDISELEGLNLPPLLKKLLDPDVSPQEYSKIDDKVDNAGNVNHQGFAIAAFAISYADKGGDIDEDRAMTVLRNALKFVPKIVKAREKGKGEN